MNICWANGSESYNKIKSKEGLGDNTKSQKLPTGIISFPPSSLPSKKSLGDDIYRNIQKIKVTEAFIELWKDRIGKRLKVVPP